MTFKLNTLYIKYISLKYKMQKKCPKCNIVKDMQDFGNQKASKDGKYSYCKSCKKQINKKYYNENFDKVAEYHYKRWRENNNVKIINKKAKEKARCGINATEFVKDKCCVACGMTNNEHFAKWNERLHIDHINNDGRANQRIGLLPNNELSNLQILCRSCHVKKDNKTKDYGKRSIFSKEDICNILNMAKESKNIRKLAMDLRYNYGTIYAIIKGKNLKRFNLTNNENN